jgi:hypothetical protein
MADEPPPRHAAIRGWPWIKRDLTLQKAPQKERAAVIASEAALLLPFVWFYACCPHKMLTKFFNLALYAYADKLFSRKLPVDSRSPDAFDG